jgi:hypothetical protein
MSSIEDAAVPTLPIYIEDSEAVTPHLLASEGLRFRAQVSGRTEHEQLEHDLGEMGCKLVSPDPDKVGGLLASIRERWSR